jgi:hypothetical protein
MQGFKKITSIFGWILLETFLPTQKNPTKLSCNYPRLDEWGVGMLNGVVSIRAFYPSSNPQLEPKYRFLCP